MSPCPTPETPPELRRRLARTPAGGERTSPCLRTPPTLRHPMRRACPAPRWSSPAGTCSRSQRRLWAGRSCGSSPESPRPLWRWWHRGDGQLPGRPGRPVPGRPAGRWASSGPVVRDRVLPVVRERPGRADRPAVRARAGRARSAVSSDGRGPDGASPVRPVRASPVEGTVRRPRAVREARKERPVRGRVRQPGRGVGRSAVRRPARAVRVGDRPDARPAAPDRGRTADAPDSKGASPQAAASGPHGSPRPDAKPSRNRPVARPPRKPPPDPYRDRLHQDRAP